jgi:hypothetical protein
MSAANALAEKERQKEEEKRRQRLEELENLVSCVLFIILPLGANFDPQGCSWPTGVKFFPQRGNPQIAPPLF